MVYEGGKDRRALPTAAAGAALGCRRPWRAQQLERTSRTGAQISQRPAYRPGDFRPGLSHQFVSPVDSLPSPHPSSSRHVALCPRQHCPPRSPSGGAQSGADSEQKLIFNSESSHDSFGWFPQGHTARTSPRVSGLRYTDLSPQQPTKYGGVYTVRVLRKLYA